MERNKKLRIENMALIIISGIFLLILETSTSYMLWPAWLIYAVMIFAYGGSILYINNSSTEILSDIENNLDIGMRNALEEAKVGVVVYDEDFNITWMSEFMLKHSVSHIGEKIYEWIKEVQPLLDGDQEEVLAIINESKYIVSKKKNANVMVFRDVTNEYDLKKKYEDEALVLGLINFDNYEEVSELEDDLAYLNTNIRPMVYDYCKEHNLVYKTLRNNRIQLILNEKQYSELKDERFSILSAVRKEAKKGDIDITLSMAFARGNGDLEELDKMASSLLEIAQTRGGDQVVTRKGDEEAQFFGGSSEAKGKRSKVKVRVVSNTLRRLLKKASNVIICGHLEADADCIGAALCLSAIASNYVEDVAIITRSGGVEKTTADILKINNDELNERHDFITESEALNRLRDDSLVIMVDHHMASNSNGQALLKEAKKIVIIDHHRRNADLDTKPLFVYIEAGASSASELVCELLPYLLKKGYLEDLEANMMYLGMIIDTNRFRVRTGERTFEAAAALKAYGADPILVDKWQKEPFENVRKVAEMVDKAEMVRKGIVVITLDSEEIYNRSLISQACDRLMEMKEVKAGFVIAHISDSEMAISARSDGSINVQLIMEKMHGGGHLTGAGVQRKEGTILELKKELVSTIDQYLEEEKKDESNIIK